MVQLAPRANPYLAGRSGLEGYAGARPFSEETAHAIDEEVHGIIAQSHAEARRLLETHRGALEKLVEALLARETLDEREIIDAAGLSPVTPARETQIAKS
jgi:cell division protease FtsH